MLDQQSSILHSCDSDIGDETFLLFGSLLLLLLLHGCRARL